MLIRSIAAETVNALSVRRQCDGDNVEIFCEG
jgi:hypothetical protein